MVRLSIGALCLFLFFKQKTAYELRVSDWSSDVCSSDLFEVGRSGCEGSDDLTASYILTFSCVDTVGIVAAVTGLLAERDGFILDSQPYAALDSGRFFMRVQFRGAGPRFPEWLA